MSQWVGGMGNGNGKKRDPRSAAKDRRKTTSSGKKKGCGKQAAAGAFLLITALYFGSQVLFRFIVKVTAAGLVPLDTPED